MAQENNDVVPGPPEDEDFHGLDLYGVVDDNHANVEQGPPLGPRRLDIEEVKLVERLASAADTRGAMERREQALLALRPVYTHEGGGPAIYRSENDDYVDYGVTTLLQFTLAPDARRGGKGWLWWALGMVVKLTRFGLSTWFYRKCLANLARLYYMPLSTPELKLWQTRAWVMVHVLIATYIRSPFFLLAKRVRVEPALAVARRAEDANIPTGLVAKVEMSFTTFGGGMDKAAMEQIVPIVRRWVKQNRPLWDEDKTLHAIISMQMHLSSKGSIGRASTRAVARVRVD